MENLREKVAAFLRGALAEGDQAERAKLLGKAVYWNDMAARVEAKQRVRTMFAQSTEHRISSSPPSAPVRPRFAQAFASDAACMGL